MTSLFLGTIGSRNSDYEVHALTKDLPFREFNKSSISDAALYNKLIQGRFQLLAGERPIYCKAINPDTEKKIEENPHDTREGTVHIVAVDQNGDIECALSAAVDTGAKDGGNLIGLPLENRWNPNGYHEGASLDTFRKRYLKSLYGKNRSINPWEMVELYRHYKKIYECRFGFKVRAIRWLVSSFSKRCQK